VFSIVRIWSATMGYCENWTTRWWSGYLHDVFTF